MPLLSRRHLQAHMETVRKIILWSDECGILNTVVNDCF